MGCVNTCCMPRPNLHLAGVHAQRSDLAVLQRRHRYCTPSFGISMAACSPFPFIYGPFICHSLTLLMQVLPRTVKRAWGRIRLDLTEDTACRPIFNVFAPALDRVCGNRCAMLHT